MSNRDPNYGNRKHKIVSSQKYMIPDFDSADELRGLLEEILEDVKLDLEDMDKRFVYKIAEHKSHLIISAKIEAAIRSGAIEDIMFAKDGETIVIKTRSGQLIPLDLQQIKGRAIGDLFEGEGKHEDDTPEMEMKRVTVAMRKLKLYDRIAENVIGLEKHHKSETDDGGKIKKIKALLASEQYSGMLVDFLDACVGKIIRGAENNGTPIKGLGKKAHKDQKIIHILKMMFSEPDPEVREMQELLIMQAEGENIRDRINGTVERFTPGTLDFVIANLNSCDPNQAVMNILQMSIQSFLRQATAALPAKNGYKNGSNGEKNGLLGVNMLGFQEFLDETVGLMNCLTRNCGEASCYGADVQTILMDFVHRNAERCRFETPKVEMVMEIAVRHNPILFCTDDDFELQHYLIKHKKKYKDMVLVIREGVKAIVPRAMLKYLGNRTAIIVPLTEEGVSFVLEAIESQDEYILNGIIPEGLTEGPIDISEYKSKRPRRQGGSDSGVVKGEHYLNSADIRRKRNQPKFLVNPNYKNVYKKYEMINNSMYMFRAYSHTQGPNKTTGTRY